MQIYRMLILLVLLISSPLSQAQECVVLLHGLVRTARSMSVLESGLSEAGYVVSNISYPSREKPIEELSEMAVSAGIDECRELGASPVNFVTHSLGGILVRYYFAEHPEIGIGRVVMLGPPNKGSEVVDRLKNMPGFDLINGPAGIQLGTDSSAIPNALGPVTFELGVIAGTRSTNPILSLFLPSTDDGKVTVESTKVDGMSDYVVLPVTHSFMMRNKKVVAEVLSFLHQGFFEHESALSKNLQR